MKSIAVLGASLIVLPAPGSTGVPGVASFVSAPSVKVRAQGAGVYRGQVQVQVSGVTNPIMGATIPSPPQVFSLPASALKVRADGEPVLLDGDSVTVSVTPAIPPPPTVPPIIPPPPPTPAPTAMIVKVQTPGQTKVRGE